MPRALKRSKIGVKAMLASCGTIKGCKANLPTPKMIQEAFSKPMSRRMKRFAIPDRVFLPALKVYSKAADARRLNIVEFLVKNK